MKRKIIFSLLILELPFFISSCNIHKKSINNVAMEETCYLAYYYDNSSFDIEKTYDFIYKEKSNGNVYCQFYYKPNNIMEKKFYSANIKFDCDNDIYYYNNKAIFTWKWHNEQYKDEQSEFKTRFEIVRDYVNELQENLSNK